jgi:hypothetical protein
MMTLKAFYIPAAALALLTLAACGDAPDNDGPAAVQTAPDGTTTLQIQVPEVLVPAVEAAQNPESTFNDLRARAGEMSEQAKRDAVVQARNLAEAGARALGQTDAQITEAGDVAERSARDALGL